MHHIIISQVMISGDSSCSDSGLEVRRGGSKGCANMRALYRGARVDQESDTVTDCSPSPHSSLLDAPLPPHLGLDQHHGHDHHGAGQHHGHDTTGASGSNHVTTRESKLCKHSSIRVQQSAVR